MLVLRVSALEVVLSVQVNLEDCVTDPLLDVDRWVPVFVLITRHLQDARTMEVTSQFSMERDVLSRTFPRMNYLLDVLLREQCVHGRTKLICVHFEES